MFGSNSLKKLPHLSRYITKTTEISPFWPRMLAGAAAGVGVLGIAAAVAAGVLISPYLFLGTLVGGAMAFAGARQLRRPKSDAQIEREMIYSTAMKYAEPLHERKLHKVLDPIAQQLLEACAFHWERIFTLLNGPEWRESSVRQAYGAIRQQCLHAADVAMGEALAICLTCMGPPEGDFKDDVESVISDFTNLDFDDAVSGVREIFRTQAWKKVHRSPYIDTVVGPVSDLAKKLQQLGNEVQGIANDARANRVPSGLGRPIDRMLTELSAIRTAEHELDVDHPDQEQQHLRLK